MDYFSWERLGSGVLQDDLAGFVEDELPHGLRAHCFGRSIGKEEEDSVLVDEVDLNDLRIFQVHVFVHRIVMFVFECHFKYPHR
ncbi:MAG: hypothetical protein JWP44_5072 [Mucilaginibacter sp.]|nr:hypothetical protein [Mucilaginibacter sp.]